MFLGYHCFEPNPEALSPGLPVPSAPHETKNIVTTKKKTVIEPLQQTVKLANGVEMPTIGFGTWQIPINEHFQSTIQTAIQLGYRHFDTAQIYNNAALIGDVIRESGIPRSEFFLTSKIWASHRSFESAEDAYAMILEQLQVDYLDLLLIHWPAAQGEPMVWQAQNAGTWRAFEKIYKAGAVRAIGVSNFLPHHLVPLLARAKVKPMVNQLEIHPGYPQRAAVRFCMDRGILVQAWSPLGRGTLLRHPTLERIASVHGVTPAQVALRWCIDLGIAPIPKATDFHHQKENLDVFGFELTPEERDELTLMPQTAFSGLHPDTVTF